MTESGELAAVGASDEATEPAARDVLQEDSARLDPCRRSGESDRAWLDEFLGHGPKTLGENSA